MLIAGLLFFVVAAICAWRAAPVFIRLAEQLRRTSIEVERVTSRLDARLLPRLEATLGETNRALRELEETAELWKGIQARAEDALVPLGDITVGVERALSPMVRTARDFGIDRRRARALGAGIRAAWRALRHRP